MQTNVICQPSPISSSHKLSEASLANGQLHLVLFAQQQKSELHLMRFN